MGGALPAHISTAKRLRQRYRKSKRKIHAPCLPFVTYFRQDRADQAQAGRSVGKDAKHQICQFHLRRWVGGALRALKESVPADYGWIIDETKTIVKELPLHGDRRLLQLLHQVPETRQGRNGSEYSPLDQLRYILVPLAEN